MGDVQSVAIAELESPIGPLRVVSTESGLAYVELPHANGRGLAGWLARNAPGVRPESAYAPNRTAAAQIVEYLEGKRERFDLRLDLRGTPFQLRVWDELLQIPYGETRSYGEIARAIGEPGAVRPVGAANGANPVALVVPCHRVVASHGLGGYRGGLDLKRHLLALESGRAARPKQGRLL